MIPYAFTTSARTTAIARLVELTALLLVLVAKKGGEGLVFLEES
jgi:hypothetical protein